ncbi:MULTISPECIES: 3-dehydroquinate synthase [Olivibacter]|uniref:3-dehydroquinate synthase n=1 Tax=Olivibacter oleidegradans TaxID=760123 RepID=A0ABV6HIG4_9SPHI|nr:MULTISPECIES: 3-dehydroquinate synthase [unclassified Olivibacter]MDM8176567.1 3-dehydroquinate synthase [Olivibacter sp. 47]QEL00828.1 3-dehydroquinate synthase [Olivibacter sp. LS-1]
MIKEIKSNTYSVYFERQFNALREFLNKNTYSKIFILTDRNTSEHCLPVFTSSMPELTAYDLIEIDPGEENKNIDFCIGIWKMLLDFGADRKSLLINLGGGVITDIGGFAASTFKRGIDFIQIPTTLLSQVDASVGGKTGIDMDGVKNIIGTFTQPKAVLINSDFLATLDERQMVSGFAEMIKHGLIYDQGYFGELQRVDLKELNEDYIYRSVVIKNDVVTKDPTEKGLRKILNFGHTIGHAVESYSLANDSFPLLHGEAIAVGMICEAYLSHRHNGLSLESLNEIRGYIMHLFPSYSFGEAIYEFLYTYMLNDKKNTGDKIGFALLNKIGSCDFDLYIQKEQIFESLDYYRSLLN